MQEVFFLLTEYIDKADIIQIIPHTLHNASHACCGHLKVIVFFIGLVIKIHKLICKPGTGIHRNTNPPGHSSGSHVFQYVHLIYDLAGIMIDLLSLHSQADSSWKPFKKLDSQGIFQCLDHLAHTWLCRVEELRCITE